MPTLDLLIHATQGNTVPEFRINEGFYYKFPAGNRRYVIHAILKLHKFTFIDFNHFQTEVSDDVVKVIIALESARGRSKITVKHIRALEKMTLDEIIEWIIPRAIANSIKP